MALRNIMVSIATVAAILTITGCGTFNSKPTIYNIGPIYDQPPPDGAENSIVLKVPKHFK